MHFDRGLLGNSGSFVAVRVRPEYAIENLLGVFGSDADASLGRQCRVSSGWGWHASTDGLRFPCLQHTEAPIQRPPEVPTQGQKLGTAQISWLGAQPT